MRDKYDVFFGIMVGLIVVDALVFVLAVIAVDSSIVAVKVCAGCIVFALLWFAICEKVEAVEIDRKYKERFKR